MEDELAALDGMLAEFDVLSMFSATKEDNDSAGPRSEREKPECKKEIGEDSWETRSNEAHVQSVEEKQTEAGGETPLLKEGDESSRIEERKTGAGEEDKAGWQWEEKGNVAKEEKALLEEEIKALRVDEERKRAKEHPMQKEKRKSAEEDEEGNKVKEEERTESARVHVEEENSAENAWFQKEEEGAPNAEEEEKKMKKANEEYPAKETMAHQEDKIAEEEKTSLQEEEMKAVAKEEAKWLKEGTEEEEKEESASVMDGCLQQEINEMGQAAEETATLSEEGTKAEKVAVTHIDEDSKRAEVDPSLQKGKRVSSGEEEERNDKVKEEERMEVALAPEEETAWFQKEEEEKRNVGEENMRMENEETIKKAEGENLVTALLAETYLEEGTRYKTEEEKQEDAGTVEDGRLQQMDEKGNAAEEVKTGLDEEKEVANACAETKEKNNPLLEKKNNEISHLEAVEMKWVVEERAEKETELTKATAKTKAIEDEEIVAKEAAQEDLEKDAKGMEEERACTQREEDEKKAAEQEKKRLEVVENENEEEEETTAAGKEIKEETSPLSEGEIELEKMVAEESQVMERKEKEGKAKSHMTGEALQGDEERTMTAERVSSQRKLEEECASIQHVGVMNVEGEDVRVEEEKTGTNGTNEMAAKENQVEQSEGEKRKGIVKDNNGSARTELGDFPPNIQEEVPASARTEQEVLSAGSSSVHPLILGRVSLQDNDAKLAAAMDEHEQELAALEAEAAELDSDSLEAGKDDDIAAILAQLEAANTKVREEAEAEERQQLLRKSVSEDTYRSNGGDRMLKVTLEGERIFKKVIIERSANLEELRTAVAAKFRLPVGDIKKLIELPDIELVDDEDVQQLAFLAEIVAVISQDDVKLKEAVEDREHAIVGGFDFGGLSVACRRSQHVISVHAAVLKDRELKRTTFFPNVGLISSTLEFIIMLFETFDVKLDDILQYSLVAFNEGVVVPVQPQTSLAAISEATDVAFTHCDFPDVLESIKFEMLARRPTHLQAENRQESVNITDPLSYMEANFMLRSDSKVMPEAQDSVKTPQEVHSGHWENVNVVCKEKSIELSSQDGSTEVVDLAGKKVGVASLARRSGTFFISDGQPFGKTMWIDADDIESALSWTSYLAKHCDCQLLRREEVATFLDGVGEDVPLSCFSKGCGCAGVLNLLTPAGKWKPAHVVILDGKLYTYKDPYTSWHYRLQLTGSSAETPAKGRDECFVLCVTAGRDFAGEYVFEAGSSDEAEKWVLAIAESRFRASNSASGSYLASLTSAELAMLLERENRFLDSLKKLLLLFEDESLEKKCVEMEIESTLKRVEETNSTLCTSPVQGADLPTDEENTVNESTVIVNATKEGSLTAATDSSAKEKENCAESFTRKQSGSEAVCNSSTSPDSGLAREDGSDRNLSGASQATESAIEREYRACAANGGGVAGRTAPVFDAKRSVRRVSFGGTVWGTIVKGEDGLDYISPEDGVYFPLTLKDGGLLFTPVDVAVTRVRSSTRSADRVEEVDVIPTESPVSRATEAVPEGPVRVPPYVLAKARAAIANPIDSVILEGTMYKSGGKNQFKGWDKRHFKLTTKHLAYFGKATDKSAKGLISIGNVTGVEYHEVKNPPKNITVKQALLVITKERTYQLFSPSPEVTREFGDYVEALVWLYSKK